MKFRCEVHLIYRAHRTVFSRIRGKQHDLISTTMSTEAQVSDVKIQAQDAKMKEEFDKHGLTQVISSTIYVIQYTIKNMHSYFGCI